MQGRNQVSRTCEGTVTKHHGGPAGVARAAAAAAAMRCADDHDLPVPRVRGVDGAVLTMADIGPTTSGATLLGRSPTVVLRTVGSFARRLHDLPPPAELLGDRTCSPGTAWVHGDLCPVNVLFGPDQDLVAVVDWEDSHLGDPLVDLAWTEWLVRTWHGRVAPRLGVLYDAYTGPVPSVTARRRAMAACLARQRTRATDPADRAEWDRRVAELPDLDLSL